MKTVTYIIFIAWICVFVSGCCHTQRMATNPIMVALFDFEGHQAAHWVRSNYCEIITNSGESIFGKASLRLSTTKANEKWLDLFVTHTNGVSMQGGKRYEISFKYASCELKGSDSFFYMLARSEQAQGPDKGWLPWRECPKPISTHKMNIVLPTGVNDYRIHFGINGTASVVLDDISIKQLPGIDLQAEGTTIPSPNYEPYGIGTHFLRLPSWGEPGFTDEQVRQSIRNLAKAGIQWIRVGAHWNQIEPFRGKNKQKVIDRLDLIIELALQEKIKVYLQLGAPPSWASEAPGEKDSWAYSPTTAVDWRAHVSMMANRYGDRINYWEIYNEIDWIFWKSDLKKYAKFLKTAYIELKKVNPENRVILGGLAFDGIHVWRLRPGAEEHALQKLYNNGIANYFDIFAMHPYSGDPEFSTVESIDKINCAYEIMLKNGDGDKQIWLTEIGMDTKGSDPAQLKDQAKILRNTYTQLIKHPKVDKIFWYTFPNYTGHNYGIVNSNFSLRPAFREYERINKEKRRVVVDDYCPMAQAKNAVIRCQVSDKSPL